MDCDGAHAIMNVESYRDMTHNDNKLPLSENECIHAKYLQRQHRIVKGLGEGYVLWCSS